MTRQRMPVIAEVEAALERLHERCGRYARPDVGFTYLVRQRETGLVKIGKSVDPVSRIGDLQNMNGGVLEVVGIVHNADMERYLHDRHEADRRHGEWFKVGDPLPAGEVCIGCLTFGLRAEEDTVLADLERLEVPDVPIAVNHNVQCGSEIGNWHPRGEPDRSYDMTGGGRIGALILSNADDRRTAALDLALLSAARTGGYFLFDMPRIRERMLSIGGHPTAWEFWPGMGRASNPRHWIDLKSTIQENLAELETLEATVNLFVHRTP